MTPWFICLVKKDQSAVTKRIKYRDCPTCANFGQNETCDVCECGEYFEPKDEADGLDFHDEDENSHE